ncbi:FUSC family protein [Melittangium boletus]|uniref:Integral membrane bound transporter domain-containing protein n=1 Tax=Melittangium boletus DSM 14713 TaxID=1294270 RepID=A0A250IK49_9BACT|nr:FUSC family protein [Melittangium boletus]ATB32155.1 hypothetical protein MEBOL_005631 [Melittangium boletus DSM 14713]
MIRRLVEHAREVVRFAPVKPAVMAGIRAAIASVLPLALAHVLHLPGGLWMCLGGFNASFADKGGSYRARATSMGAGLIAGALAVGLGVVAGAHPVLSIAVALLWVTACSFGGAYGAAANVVGNTAASAFVVSLGLPHQELSEALQRGGFLALGALWAMFLSLVLWPIRPYGPSRLAVAQCFRAVEEYAGEVNRLFLSGAEGEAWQAVIQRHHASIRETLEVAGSTLAATRRGRGESERGEQLLVLLQIAEVMFGTVIALGDVLESLCREARDEPAWTHVERTLATFRQELLRLARGVETEGRVRELPSVEWARAPGEAARSLEEGERAALGYAFRLLAQLRDFVEAAAKTETRLAGERTAPQGPPPTWKQRVLGPLRDNLSLDSMVLRHALRVGLTTTVAVGTALAFIPSHGYWVTITVLTIMQPYTGATFLKGLQRVTGTVVGGLLAAAIASSLHSPYVILPFVFVTVAISIAIIPLNYGLYTVFLTLTFVLLAEWETGDMTLPQVRVLNTLMGGALALAGTWLLWERSERELLPEQLAAALRANREHFLLVLSDRLGSAPRRPDELFSEARRKIGLATLNAEASFQRLLSEPRRRTEPIEPLMTLLAYLRRFAASVVSVSVSPRDEVSQRIRAQVERFVDSAALALEDLAEAVHRGRVPSPPPDLLGWLRWNGQTEAELEPLLRLQLERVARRILVLHGAVSRRAAQTPLERPSAPAAHPGA